MICGRWRAITRSCNEDLKVASFEFELNGKPVTVQAEPDMPLLWVLRDLLALNGTKYGCGRGLCGCCTVHIDGEAVRSCMAPIESVTGRRVVTIEGLAEDDSHPVLHAWQELNVDPASIQRTSGQLGSNCRAGARLCASRARSSGRPCY